MRKFTKNNKGFTIIEVMIVLTIAGLIMGIVFLALPSLQRTQKDTRRTNEINRFKADMEAFSVNNNSRYPFMPTSGTTLAWDTTNYCNKYWTSLNLQDPSVGAYSCDTTSLPLGTCGVTAPNECSGTLNTPAAGKIQIITDAKCSSNKAIGASSTTGGDATNMRQYAIMVRMERGNYTCVDNG